MTRVSAGRRDLLAELDREARRTGSLSAMHAKAIAERLGVHGTDYECIDILDWTGPITAGELARHLGLTAGAVTGLIDRLEQRGWVRRARDPSDRRKVIVELAPQPALDADAADVFGPLAIEMGDVNASYDDDQLAAIVNWLQRANAALERSIDRLRARPSRSAAR